MELTSGPKLKQGVQSHISSTIVEYSPHILVTCMTDSTDRLTLSLKPAVWVSLVKVSTILQQKKFRLQCTT